MLIVTMLSVFGGGVGAQEKSSCADAFGESEVMNTAQQWASLVSQADIVGLEQLLSDNYMHIHSTALVESKSQFIDAFKNGSRKYDTIKIDEAKARVFDNTAVVTGKFNLKAFARGKIIEGVNRFGMVLVKTKEGIHVVSYQSTAIPQQKKIIGHSNKKGGVGNRSLNCYTSSVIRNKHNSRLIFCG